MFEHLEWDSQFFGFNVARITTNNITRETLRDVLSGLKEKNYRLAYWAVDPENDQNNNDASFFKGFLADNKVTFKLDINNVTEIKPVKNISSYIKHTTNEDLINLAVQSGEYSRFRIDKNFSEKQFIDLYTKWIENSVSRKICNEVFVYIDKEKITGMITLVQKDESCQIGLIAVVKEHRGKGIGSFLINKSISYCKDIDKKNLQVVTQLRNKQACKFYRKYMFEVLKIENIYHFWLS